MSSQIYRDKSIEELYPIIQNFILNYTHLFKADPDLQALALKIRELKNQKEEKLFKESFETLTPKNIRDAEDIVLTLLERQKLDQENRDNSIKHKKSKLGK